LSAHQGTMFEGLRKPEMVILTVVILVSYGCPPQAIVHAFGVDERTVARWQQRAGAHCQNIHQALVMQAELDLEHVQADEIRVKACKKIPWIAMAEMVKTRLWLGGVVSLTRDRHLADQLMRLVKACCLPLCLLLVLTDGWAAYPNSIGRAFREKDKPSSGRGRRRLLAWPEVLIGTVIKRTQKKRVVEVARRRTQGCLDTALRLLQTAGGGNDLNTAFIERLNGTFRERLEERIGRSHMYQFLGCFVPMSWRCRPVVGKSLLPFMLQCSGRCIQVDGLDEGARTCAGLQEAGRS
jgi:hypothetical protein